MPDDEVTRVGIRHADIAEVVEHGRLGDPETRGDVRGGKVEINEGDPQRLRRTGGRLPIPALHREERGYLGGQGGPARPAFRREKGDDLRPAEVHGRRVGSTWVALRFGITIGTGNCVGQLDDVAVADGFGLRWRWRWRWRRGHRCMGLATQDTKARLARGDRRVSRSNLAVVGDRG